VPEALVPALAAIIAETTAACEWLSADVDGHEPISFVPNPGNIGDAAINVACHAFLEARFDRIELRAMAESPPTECVFVGGGGNLVEPLYSNVRDWLVARVIRTEGIVFSA
jgi:exopolysaccharide biosynthesis predicted pyruvyltransferase EpsI